MQALLQNFVLDSLLMFLFTILKSYLIFCLFKVWQFALQM